MYKQILIPVTGPAEVEPLIGFAAQLLEADGEIRLLHVISNESLTDVTRQWRSSVNIVIPAHEAGAALDVRVEPEVRSAHDVATEILERSETGGVDAILMTLRGARRERNPFVGHTASSILHHATCDVLVVNRLALAEKSIRRVLVPSLGTGPPPKVLRLAEEIAVHNQGVPIITLAISPRGDEGGSNRAPPSRTPRGVPMQMHRSFFSDAILGRRRQLPRLILSSAAREKFGLLLVGDDPTSDTGSILTRTFLDELFRSAPCPVVALHG
ncbi:MAG: universal stress protein [Thermoplasmata archaeon]|nr:universal stress protein [Thermoplasmata archaeon]